MKEKRLLNFLVGGGQSEGRASSRWRGFLTWEALPCPQLSGKNCTADSKQQFTETGMKVKTRNATQSHSNVILFHLINNFYIQHHCLDIAFCPLLFHFFTKPIYNIKTKLELFNSGSNSRKTRMTVACNFIRYRSVHAHFLQFLWTFATSTHLNMDSYFAIV